MQHGSNTVLWFCVVLVVLGDEMKERDNLVQFSKGERVSVTSLFLKERVSNFCFLASGSSSLSFLSCPRSATGDRVSVTVLFLVSVTFQSILSLFDLFLSSRVSYFSSSAFPFEAVPFSSFLSWPRSDTGESVSVTVLETSFRFVKEIFFLLVSLFLDGPSTRNPSYGLTSWPQILHHHRSLELTLKSRDTMTQPSDYEQQCNAWGLGPRFFQNTPSWIDIIEEVPVAQFQGIKLLGAIRSICAVFSVFLRFCCVLSEVFLQGKSLCHCSGKAL